MNPKVQMDKAYLGIDIGTTQVKCAAYTLQGRLLGSAARSYPLYYPAPERAEQDVGEMWAAVVEAVREVHARVLHSGYEIYSLSLSTQGGTTILVGEDGRVLRRAISWMDHRGEALRRAIEEQLSADEIYAYSGWEFTGVLSLAHLFWLKHNQPELFGQACYLMTVNDYFIHRLTGVRCQDPSNAGISQLYDIHKLRLEPRAVNLLGVGAEKFSPMQPSGTAVGVLQREVAVELGLPQDVVVVNGAHDQCAAALGCGVVEAGQVLLSSGTAWVLLLTTETPFTGPEDGLMGISRHAVPGKWGAMRSMGRMGGVIDWTVENILHRKGSEGAFDPAEAYELINQGVPLVPVGANGLLCVPMDGGHGAWARKPGGVFWGLNSKHTVYDMGRAVLEGLAFELAWLIGIYRAHQLEIRSLIMVGGASRSEVLPQIIADVIGKPVTVPEGVVAASRGAALMAAVGGGEASFQEGFQGMAWEEKKFEPETRRHADYQKVFKRYQKAANAFINCHLEET